jgi:hypothetical protein
MVILQTLGGLLLAVCVVEEERLRMAAGARGGRPRSIRVDVDAPSDPHWRIYAAYGGVYVAIAVIWLRRVDRVQLTAWDLSGVAIVLIGMGIIV